MQTSVQHRIRLLQPGRRDRGAASAEIVVVMPLLLLVLLGLVQCSLIVHAHHVAQAVAARAVDTAREQHGTDAEGVGDGRALLASLDSQALGTPVIAVQRTATTVSATVSGEVAGIVPFWRPRIVAHAAGPVERITGPGTP